MPSLAAAPSSSPGRPEALAGWPPSSWRAAGAEVVLLVRDRAKAEATVREIRAAAPSAPVSYRLGDLAVLSEVRRLAAEVSSEHPEVHVLLNDAGAVLRLPPAHLGGDRADLGAERALPLPADPPPPRPAADGGPGADRQRRLRRARGPVARLLRPGSRAPLLRVPGVRSLQARPGHDDLRARPPPGGKRDHRQRAPSRLRGDRLRAEQPRRHRAGVGGPGVPVRPTPRPRGAHLHLPRGGTGGGGSLRPGPHR